ncbi:hypothetical protein PP175_04875 [Aneurinibacillus sp. Ricciae_BoGa-3]|nr:hypothetical protein [Aneurinibacillus sp. Ricciae_BoGa-3]WCK55316.1 hypothetical protein PP175_04875 [Aneurinibacillus sp. Ricciae_BoGa-3]
MDGSFKQTISVWQGIALYVGAVIGSGILIIRIYQLQAWPRPVGPPC